MRVHEPAEKPRRRLRFRQCDLERAIRAAKAAGAARVVVRLDGSFAIELEASEDDEPAAAAREAFPLW